MKYLNKLLGICLTVFLLVTLSPAPTQAQQPGESVSFQTFYDELQPYGTWVNDPDFGDVWVPDVDEDFKPYATNGHWIVTEYGNTWESDYEWGWAPFHYGRWRFDDYYGWEWIPGSEWGPAWVNWRTGGGYYAWAPLGPRVSIDVSFGQDYSIPDDYWVCAPYAYITSPRIYDYYVPRTRVVNVIRNTTIINNVYVSNNRRYVAGPRAQDIERYTNRHVDIYRVNNVNDPRSRGISNNTINIYRPNISRGSNNGPDRPRPERVIDANAYRNAHPNEGLGNRGGNIGAVVNHNNASKLAQTARDNRPDNSNVVHVNRPGGAPGGSFPTNNPNGNNGRYNRPGGQPNQGGQQNTGVPANNSTHVGATSGTIPADNNNNNNGGRFNRNGGQQNQQPTQQGNPATTTPDQNPNYGRYNRNNGQQNQQPTQQGNPAATTTPTDQNNNGRYNRNRGQQNQGGQQNNNGQPAQNGQPVTTPVPNTTTTTPTDNNNGGYRNGRFNRPAQSAPATGNSPTVVRPQQSTDQQAQQQQQRQQQMQQRQQQMQQQRQQQPQQNPQADQQRQQQMQQAQQQRQQQQQAQQQAQQQQAAQQRQQQQQAQQQRAQQQQQQRQQQRPQPQPQQERPKPVEQKADHPPM